MPESRATKWLRRYRWIIIIIVCMLIGQLVLALLLPKLSSSHPQPHSGDHSANNAAGQRNAITDALASKHSHRSTAPASPPHTPTAAQYTLRAGEVTVAANCSIATKEAVSAIHRARTARCKQQIADVTCAIQAGEFYAHTLPNSCPNGSFIANRALGCYRDVKKARLLDGYYTNFKQLNTPGKCIQLCLQSGFLYAGVQYGSECFCGNTEPPAAVRLDGTECMYACVGEPEQQCGGYFAMNVYETGISKFVPQVAELRDSGTDRDTVRIVFLLTLNGRAVRQVHRLLRALYNPQHFYYIHVDERQDYLYEQLLPLETRAPNIRLARRRFSTIWGGASLLRMLLAAMRALLHDHADWRWDFVINLSESDFPVKTVDRLAAFLTANRDRNFVKSHGREVQRFIQKQGLDKTFVECDTHMWRTGDRQLPAGIQIDGGSDWVALARPFVEYVTAERGDALVGGLLRIFEHTLLPAESFFHTALRNSEFCNTYVDNNLHVTNWKRKLGCKCQYKHVVDWCGCSPNDFKPDDWPRLLSTETKQVFFARKFEAVVNQAVLLKLETWLFGQTRVLAVPNVRSYWQNVYAWPVEGPVRGEETLHAVAASVLRLKLAAQLHSIEHIEQVNIYMENDQHRGFLVRAAVRLVADATRRVEIEVWARHDQLPQASRSLAVGKRIVHLEVSTEFDQKEQIARNFVKIIGVQSEPVLVMHFTEPPAAAAATVTSAATAAATTAVTFNCTCLWISPAGRLEDVSDMHVEESTSGGSGHSVHFSKPTLQLPLLAGVWTVKVLHKRGVVGKCDFFVVPAERTAGTTAAELSTRTDGTTAAELTTTTASPVPVLLERDILSRSLDNADAWSTFVPGAEERDNQTAQALRDVNAVGAERMQWLDSMVKRFVVLRDVCLVAGDTTTLEADTMALCAETSWSSLALDPKSDIYADLSAN